MKRMVKSSSYKYATPQDAERIVNELGDSLECEAKVVYSDDEVIVFTVDGNKCSINFKYMDKSDLERSIYELAEGALTGSYEDIEYDDIV